MTQVRDLGLLEGPVLIFGGPYGNLEACEALLAAAERRGIAGRNAICTGDVVAYGADPQAVVDRLRSWDCAIVMGNCEESLAADAADCGCGFNEGSTCAALSAQWFSATRRDLDIASKQWMGTLPRRQKRRPHHVPRALPPTESGTPCRRMLGCRLKQKN